MLLLSLPALCMGIASCVLLYTDHRINQAGMASPRLFGEGWTGLIAILLQPWLILLAKIDSIHLYAWSLPEFVGLGVISGAVLFGGEILALRCCPRVLTTVSIVFVVLGLACTSFALSNLFFLRRLSDSDHRTDTTKRDSRGTGCEGRAA